MYVSKSIFATPEPANKEIQYGTFTITALALIVILSISHISTLKYIYCQGINVRAQQVMVNLLAKFYLFSASLLRIIQTKVNNFSYLYAFVGGC